MDVHSERSHVRPSQDGDGRFKSAGPEMVAGKAGRTISGYRLLGKMSKRAKRIGLGAGNGLHSGVTVCWLLAA